MNNSTQLNLTSALGYRWVPQRSFLLAFILPAVLPVEAIAASYIELPDHELSNLRGKYINTAGTVYFGLEMHTQWHTSHGAAHQIGMKVNFTFDHQKAPTMNISYTGDLGDETGTTQPIYLPSSPSLSQEATDTSGLTNVSGVVQANQISGNQNQSLNTLDLSLTQDTVANTPEQIKQNSQPIKVLNQSTQYQNKQGVKTSLVAERNSLGYQIAMPGQGVVTQMISGDSLKQSGQIMQMSQLYGNGNQLFNQLRLQLKSDSRNQRHYNYYNSLVNRGLK